MVYYYRIATYSFIAMKSKEEQTPSTPGSDEWLDDSSEPGTISEKQVKRMSFKARQLKLKNKIAINPAIPLTTNFSKGVERLGHSVAEMAELERPASEAIRTASESFQYAHLVLTALDFLIYPGLYLAAKVQKKPPPTKPSKTARWLYSGMILALVAISIAVPPAGLIMGCLLTGLAIAESIYYLGKMIKKYYRAKKDIEDTQKKIDEAMVELEELHEKTIAAEVNLESKRAGGDSLKIGGAQIELDLVAKDFNACHDKIQALYDQKHLYEVRKNKLNVLSAIDRGLSLGLAIAGAVGIVLSLFFPPVGLGILAACAGIGGAYCLFRLGKYIYDKITASKKPPTQDTEEQARPSNSGSATMLMMDRLAASPQISDPHAVSKNPEPPETNEMETISTASSHSSADSLSSTLLTDNSEEEPTNSPEGSSPKSR